MQKDQGFLGRQIEGVSCGYNVKLKLTPAEKMEIHLENRQTNQIYLCLIKQEDIRKQNQRIHCDLIETPSQLFQYTQSLRSNQSSFEELIKVQPKGKVYIKLQIQLNFGKGNKKKTIIYEFQTALQSMTSVDKLRNQVNLLLNQKTKFQKQSQKRIEDAQEQIKRCKKQIQSLQKNCQNSLKPTQDKPLAEIRMTSDKNSLIIKNGTYLQTANKLNMMLIGQPLSQYEALEWKVLILSKTILVFGAGSYEIINLQNVALKEEIAHSKLLKQEFFSGGEILTCKFEEGQLRYVIEKGDIEEDQGSKPQLNYNLRRGQFSCRHLNRFDTLFPCFGLHFGGRIEIISLGPQKKT